MLLTHHTTDVLGPVQMLTLCAVIKSRYMLTISCKYRWPTDLLVHLPPLPSFPCVALQPIYYLERTTALFLG